jgi:hypothetical protein
MGWVEGGAKSVGELDGVESAGEDGGDPSVPSASQ